MNGAQLSRAEIVRNHNTLESPFPSKDILKQMAVAVRGNAIDFIVRRHYRADVSLRDSGFKGLQEIFANDAFGVVSRCDIGAAFRLAVNGEVFGGGKNV